MGTRLGGSKYGLREQADSRVRVRVNSRVDSCLSLSQPRECTLDHALWNTADEDTGNKIFSSMQLCSLNTGQYIWSMSVSPHRWVLALGLRNGSICTWNIHRAMHVMEALCIDSALVKYKASLPERQPWEVILSTDWKTSEGTVEEDPYSSVEALFSKLEAMRGSDSQPRAGKSHSEFDLRL